MSDATPATFEHNIWQTLDEAAKTPGHAMRWATLGYQDGAASPVLKTVMLRGLDLAARSLRFYTDARSNKMAPLSAPITARASLLFVDLAENVQFSVRGRAIVHQPGSDVSNIKFKSLSPRQHQDYATVKAPGSQAASPRLGDQRDVDLAAENFAVIDITVDDMDLVILGAPTIRIGGNYQRRDNPAEASFSGQWLVP